MLTKLKLTIFALGYMAVSIATAQQDPTPAPLTDETTPDQVAVMHENLFPEGIEWDAVNGRFLVSSVSEGTVYAVADDGSTSPLVIDERIPSSIGIEVDEAGNRLLVAATDLKSKALLGIYDLTSGDNLAWVDFAPLLPDAERFANDVAVDAQGNAYVTDSLAGVIYQVDTAGNASVFLEHETFSTQFALNGIVYSEAGNYLLAVRVPGLIKIPIDNPAAFTPVEMDTKIPGADGIVFTADGALAVVSNNLGRVYRVESDDDFVTARATGMFETGQVNPTTVALRGEDVYVLYAYLNADEEPVSSFPIQRVEWSAPAE